MRKRTILILSLAIMLTFAGCIHTTTKLDSAAALQANESQQESVSPESAKTGVPDQTAVAGHADTVTQYDVSYADIADVFANADKYIGKVYAGPFQISSDVQKSDDKWVAIGIAYSKNKDESYYAFLTFDKAAPSLTKGDVVYAYGTLEGTTQVASKNGDYQIPFLILSINLLETELPETANAAKEASFSFTDAACAGTQDTLRIELYNLTFSKDGMMLSTKTTDSAVAGRSTYYVDIFAHQNGHFVWYPNCDFWVTGGLIGFDNIPLHSLDPSQDLVLEFFPFSESGRLLYPAVAISVPLSQQQK